MRAEGRLSRGEWIALGVAIVIAHLFYWRIVVYPSDFDARNYFLIAEDIERNGLFGKFYYSDVRTYAYPLLLAALLRIAAGARLPVGWLLFETQLVLFLLAAYFFRRRIAAVWPSFAPWAFIGVVVNLFALSYVPESLTESVSLSLLLLMAGCWLAFVTHATWHSILAGSFAVGMAVMVRPANVFALVAWCIGIAAICVARRPRLAVVSGLAIVLIAGVMLPILPQYVNNVRYYGAHTPLVSARLAENQQVWGIASLKYATALSPVPNPSIFYENPFAKTNPVDENRPLAWYFEHPRAGALTLGLHTFNLLDQDLLFTYSRDLDPWYRIPLGIATHAIVCAGLIGIGILACRARDSRNDALAAIALIAFIAAHIALHATTAVEMRFGLPLLVIAGPAAIGAVRVLSRVAMRMRLIAAMAIIAYTAASLALSDWVRQQAPSIRAWEAAHGARHEGG